MDVDGFPLRSYILRGEKYSKREQRLTSDNLMRKMNPPISVMCELPFLKHCRLSLVRMKNLSFHRENILSRCCHKTPFRRLADEST